MRTVAHAFSGLVFVFPDDLLCFVQVVVDVSGCIIEHFRDLRGPIAVERMKDQRVQELGVPLPEVFANLVVFLPLDDLFQDAIGRVVDWFIAFHQCVQADKIRLLGLVLSAIRAFVAMDVVRAVPECFLFSRDQAPVVAVGCPPVLFEILDDVLVDFRARRRQMNQVDFLPGPPVLALRPADMQRLELAFVFDDDGSRVDRFSGTHHSPDRDQFFVRVVVRVVFDVVFSEILFLFHAWFAPFLVWNRRNQAKKCIGNKRASFRTSFLRSFLMHSPVSSCADHRGISDRHPRLSTRIDTALVMLASVFIGSDL